MAKRERETVREATEAVEKLFSDTSVGIETTLLDLRSLREDLDMKIECLKADIARAARD